MTFNQGVHKISLQVFLHEERKEIFLFSVVDVFGEGFILS